MFPEDFTNRIVQQFPDTHADLLQALDGKSPVSIRYNPDKVRGIAAPHTPVPWNKYGAYLEKRPPFTFDPHFHAGAYYVQEASSMLLGQALVEVLNIIGQDPVVLDLCGAPGGKTTLLASAMQNKGVLVANEVIKSRAQILRENVIKWGAHNVVVTQNDARHFARLPHHFDVVVVDAPCSGEGMFRKDLKARQEWSMDNAAFCAERQRRILADIWPAIKPGGFVIYSTCTFNPAENEDNLAWMKQQELAEHFNWQLPSDWGFQACQHEGMTGYAAYPHHVKGEGFYIGIVQKVADLAENKTLGNAKGPKHAFYPDRKMLTGLPFSRDITDAVIMAGETLAYMPAAEKCWLPVLSQLRVLHAGVPLGQWKGTQFVPAHASAMAGLIPDGVEQVALTDEQALAYLRGQAFRLDEAPKGWLAMTYNELPLGYCKNLGNRCNNYYPKGWVVRSQTPMDTLPRVVKGRMMR